MVAHNYTLMRQVTMEEVEQVIKDMAFSKALGPYGFTMNFYHHCWPFLKEEVWQIMEKSRQTRGVLSAFNANLLTLIPKSNNFINPKDFRPISLCNVIYKIITKVLAS